MRVLLAGLAGAVAMFIWTAIAHVATPLGTIGFSQIPNEAGVVQAMDSAIGAKPGLYFFPWVAPNDRKMMEKVAAAERAHGHGLLLYHGPGQNIDSDMSPMLIKEFLKQFVQALIAAWIVSMLAVGYVTRVLVVTVIGVSAGIATNVSYWNWYGFPMDYTEVQVLIEIVSGFVAGLAIAAIVRPSGIGVRT
jgi:hypothetical protein